MAWIRKLLNPRKYFPKNRTQRKRRNTLSKKTGTTEKMRRNPATEQNVRELIRTALNSGTPSKRRHAIGRIQSLLIFARKKRWEIRKDWNDRELAKYCVDMYRKILRMSKQDPDKGVRTLAVKTVKEQRATYETLVRRIKETQGLERKLP